MKYQVLQLCRKTGSATPCSFYNQYSQCSQYSQWTLELLFPADNYLVSGTFVFPSNLHIRGEGPAAFRLDTESWLGGGEPFSRLIVANTAIVQFVPPSTGWYRLMGNAIQQGAFGGRLAISSYHNDCAN